MAKKETAAKAAEKVAETSVAADATESKGVKEQATAIDYNYEDIIKESLLRTGREGVMELIPFMRKIGYFDAPASGGNHSHIKGGLAQHSVNVMWTAEKMSLALYGSKGLTDEIRQSLVIVSLLHDLGKCGDYGKQMYVENVLKSGKVSEAKPFKRNPNLLPLDHASRSIKLATLFIDLTEEEEFAIRYHDGLYETANYGVKGNETEMYMILHWSDMWASKVVEGDEGSGEE